MRRLLYVDSIRGSALLFMIFFQLLDMFSTYNLYGMAWFKIVNWASTFFIVAGFSMRLMFEKYALKRFYMKVLKRFIYFAGIGYFLTFWCEFKVPSPFIGEIVASIGLNLAILSLFFLFTFKVTSVYSNALYFFVLFFIMFMLNRLIYLDVMFNPLILLPYMYIGVMLGFLKDTKPFLIAQYIEKIPLAKVLAYFGQHSLFFYFFHYAIFQKLLLVTNTFKSFSTHEGILLTLLSIPMLVILQKTLPTNSRKIIASILHFKK